MPARRFAPPFLVLALLAGLLVPMARADARVETRVRTRLGGALGGVANLFAGRQAKEGIVTVEMVAGDRMLTRSGRHGQIVDLGEEKAWDVDFKRGRVVSETTFDELRRQFAEVREVLSGQAESDGDATPDVEIEVSVEDGGETAEILGHEARKKVVRVVAHRRGVPLEKGGGAVLEADVWLGPELAPIEEVEAFQRRYAAAIGLPGAGPAGDSPAIARDAALVRVMKAFEEQAADWKGSALRTRMSVWTVGGAAAEERPKGLGGMLGRLGRRKKKAKEDDGPAGGRLVLRVESEVTAVSDELPAGALDLPGGGS